MTKLILSKATMSAVKFWLYSGGAVGVQALISGIGSLHQNEIVTLIVAGFLKALMTYLQTQSNINKEG